VTAAANWPDERARTMSAAFGSPRWLTAFIDFPASEFEAGTRFWLAATGYRLSDSRGEQAEFASLLPTDGDDYLRVQRLGDGPTRLHLDVHVDDPWAVAEQAEAAGAELVDAGQHSYVVLRSPAGIVFCLVTQRLAATPAATSWDGGHDSRVDEVVFDIPADDLAAELAFWKALAGGDWWAVEGSYPFEARPADGWALRLRLQPAAIARTPVGHLHIRTADRAAEVARLVGAGAVVTAVRDGWTVMAGPGGMSLCVLETSGDVSD
jgi:hypothetical protein